MRHLGGQRLPADVRRQVDALLQTVLDEGLNGGVRMGRDDRQIARLPGNGQRAGRGEGAKGGRRRGGWRGRWWTSVEVATATFSSIDALLLLQTVHLVHGEGEGGG